MNFPGFTRFDEDPFFEGHKERLSGFNESFMNDFMTSRPLLRQTGNAIEGTAPNERRVAERTGGASKDFSERQDIFGFGGMFNAVHRHMNDMMQSMMSVPDDMMSKLPTDSDGGHSYMQSSVYSYNNTGEGDPKVYEAHKSRLSAPGGISEEKRTLKDSSRKLEKMRVSRRMKEREHAVEKSRHTDTNQLHQHQELVGMKEDDVEMFKREWQDATSGMGFFGNEPSDRRQHRQVENRHHRPRAIEDGKTRSKY